MDNTFYYASNDAMFKRIFGDERDIEPLVAFLQAALDLPPEDYAELSLVNPFLARDNPDDKLGILDVRLKTASGKNIDIEIQINSVTEIRERIIYYLARMVTDQIGNGDDYQDITRSICILITDFVLIQEHASRLTPPFMAESSETKHRLAPKAPQDRIEESPAFRQG